MSLVRAAAAAIALLSMQSLADPPRHESKLITLDVVRADIHDVLRILAEKGGLNVVVADEVQGKVTLRLRNVPWRQVLDTVLSTNGLGHELRGNVLRVAPLKQLAEEAEARTKLKQTREDMAPLHTYLIPVNYAVASDLLPHVKAQLSPRGTVSVDARTNTLIVTDVGPVTLP